MSELQLLSTGPSMELKYHLKEDSLIFKTSGFGFPPDLPAYVAILLSHVIT